ncbi:filamentous hemagglutinin N-terminal domain-containing protein [Scytonema sp. UIC 10036]|uniref:two-partner secretion domain-containing protein n=1 Tax=Scytonema sp. UIC 10036 TaxID=2304196 RepID=UPI0012DA130D|nr:S-layer family protein [Scytonema sp. UIC 10036]MUG93731.1 filamentous hemagglutinin N-terminal domain-containing protein [Scytonema sp. UIC 10036]
MIQDHWQSFWKLLGVLVVCNAMITGFENSASAQIVPDNTLGNESSQVTNNLNIGELPAQLIEGGAIRGVNLFQSFSQFNVGDGERVYFANPVGIQNILSRVTGQDPSKIFGLLGVNGSANLFLINPNGIIFGQNARLDVAGSFVGTTANAIGFGQNGFFSTSSPQAPSPLLTVNPSVLLVNQINAASIQNNATTTGLQVPESRNLFLVGGNINMDGGILVAPGGRVELGGLASDGTVGLSTNGNIFSLNFPEGVQRADVSLSNNAIVSVVSSGGGSIAINAKNLDISGSSLFAGIASTIGTVDSQAGDIILNSTEQIKVEQGSIIGNIVFSGATGNSGNIRITTGSIFVTDGAQLNTSTSEQGSAGNVIIDARQNVFVNASNVLTSTVEGSVGNAGTISINTETLSVANGAVLATSSFGKGSAGSVNIDARDNVFFDGGTATTSASENSVGNTGDIRITTGSFSATNGSEFTTIHLGSGSAGNIIINARENVLFDASFPTTSVGANVIGNSGDIRITTGSFIVTNSATLSTTMFGKGSAGSIIIDAFENVLFDKANASTVVGENAIGNGGDIRITTESLSVINVSVIGTSSLGQGSAGNLIINARENVSFDDGNAITSVLENGIGNSGDIRVTSKTLSVTNGSLLAANINGQGRAGNIQINAKDSVTVSGSNPKSGVSSTLFTDTASTGSGGNITVNTNVFRVTDGGKLDAGTLTSGNGGNITVNASLFEALNGGQLITTTTSGSGRAGKITVNATDKVIVDGTDATFDERLSKFGTIVGNPNAASGFFVFSNSSGIAGDIEVNSPKITLDNGGRFIAESASGNGGNINLQVDELLLMRRGAQISTSAGTDQEGGDGGNINLNSQFLVAIPNENSDIIANAFTGSGGKVTINTSGIYGLQLLSGAELRRLNANSNPRELLTNDISAVSQQGGPQLDGQITVNNPDVDPNNGLVSLPVDVIDPSNQIAQGCAAFDEATASDFKVTGRGGLPPSPDETLSSNAVWEDTRLRATTAQRLDSKTTATKPQSESDTVITPATGWVFNGKGDVTLVSQMPNATAETLAASSQSCYLH